MNTLLSRCNYYYYYYQVRRTRATYGSRPPAGLYVVARVIFRHLFSSSKRIHVRQYILIVSKRTRILLLHCFLVFCANRAIYPAWLWIDVEETLVWLLFPLPRVPRLMVTRYKVLVETLLSTWAPRWLSLSSSSSSPATTHSLPTKFSSSTWSMVKNVRKKQ